jgi:Icc-related predicted phosphoesterase
MSDVSTPGGWRANDRRRTDRRRPRAVRIAAVGDFHCGVEDAGRYRELFARANDDADVLILAGDLTRRGTPAEMRVVCGELADVKIPILAVYGNHDHEGGEIDAANDILRERGVHLLGTEPFELNEHVGFAGAKGFMGGFGRWTLTSFGEHETKAFVGSTLEEVQRLEFGLRRLSTPIRVAVLHYAPTLETVVGEPEQIYPFLGNDRLAEPLDRFGVAVAFHGHAHHGTFRGATPGGVPVFNVSLSLLRQEKVGEMYFRYDIPIPAAAEGEPGDGEPVAAGAAAAATPSAPGSA